MNDDVEVNEQEVELEALKARADAMGVKYHPNIGADKLREKIAEASESAPAPVEEETNADTSANAKRKSKTRQELQKEAARLRRVRITCMNPMKSEWEGEIFTSGNNVVGSFKKYVPFEADWHVPQILLNMIEDRMYQTFYTVRDPRTGQQGRRGKLVKEFAIEYLPDLTKAELEDLARRQAMARGTSEA